MKIGFTGTRRGMTDRQKEDLSLWLKKLHESDKDEFHFGDCIGSDKEAAFIAKALGYRLICHPPIDSKARAFVKSDKVFDEKEYLDRNKDIVESGYILLATPETVTEQQRSGTWATIRYGRKIHKWTVVLGP